MDLVLRRIASILEHIAAPGTFAVRHEESAQGLALEVDGVGLCRFPLGPDRVRALVDAAVPSPFGYRDETRHDPSVRDSWEIPADRVTLDDRWSARLERGVAAIVEALGFPDDAEVTPTLQKLLIYEPGQFFTRHRDTEKAPTTAASLVVVLPGAYAGGEVVVAHRDDEVTFDTAAASAALQLSFLGFYTDCVHETRPVTTGARVALTFSLELASPGERPHVPSTDALADSLRAYFEARGEDGWLVHLLDHQYSKQSLAWPHLKNVDRTRSAALLKAAHDLGLDGYLALVDTVDTYAFDDAEAMDGDDGDDEGDAAAAATPSEQRVWWTLGWGPAPPPADVWPGDRLHVEAPADVGGGLGPLRHREATVYHWVDAEGRTCDGPEEAVGDDAMVALAGPDEWTSYEVECEPWTGNEGGEAMKWYRLSAVVLVPRGTVPDAEEQAGPQPSVRRRPRASLT